MCSLNNCTGKSLDVKKNNSEVLGPGPVNFIDYDFDNIASSFSCYRGGGSHSINLPFLSSPTQTNNLGPHHCKLAYREIEHISITQSRSIIPNNLNSTSATKHSIQLRTRTQYTT